MNPTEIASIKAAQHSVLLGRPSELVVIALAAPSRGHGGNHIHTANSQSFQQVGVAGVLVEVEADGQRRTARDGWRARCSRSRRSDSDCSSAISRSIDSLFA